jgi:hypothetical protein
VLARGWDVTGKIYIPNEAEAGLLTCNSPNPYQRKTLSISNQQGWMGHMEDTYGQTALPPSELPIPIPIP